MFNELCTSFISLFGLLFQMMGAKQILSPSIAFMLASLIATSLGIIIQRGSSYPLLPKNRIIKFERQFLLQNSNTGKILLIRNFLAEPCVDNEIWCRIINVDRHCSDLIIKEMCQVSCKVCEGNCFELYRFSKYNLIQNFC